jgi:hypothetical protein
MTFARIRRGLNGRRLLFTLLAISVTTFMVLALFQSAALSNLPAFGAGVKGGSPRSSVTIHHNSKGGTRSSRSKGSKQIAPSSSDDDGEGPEEEDDSSNAANSDDNNDKPVPPRGDNDGSRRSSKKGGETPPPSSSSSSNTKGKRPRCDKDGTMILVRIVGNDLSGITSLISIYYTLSFAPWNDFNCCLIFGVVNRSTCTKSIANESTLYIEK